MAVNAAWRVAQGFSVGIMVAAVGLATDGFGTRTLVVNTTDSLPQGLYVRTFGAISRGSVVRLPLPDPMVDYIAHWPEWLAVLEKGGLLKPVVGMAGDEICRSLLDEFSVNGRVLGTARQKGPDGWALPSWSGCRVLGAYQIAVFSDRIPDSIDSRIFGAVPINTAVPYRLLWEF